MKHRAALVVLLLIFCSALMLPEPAMATSNKALQKQVAALKKDVKYWKAAVGRNHVVMAQQESLLEVFIPETLMLERVVEITGYSLDEGTFHDALYGSSTDISDSYASADEWVDSGIGTLPFTSVGVHPSSVTTSPRRSLSMRPAIRTFRLYYPGLKKQ